MARAKRSPIWRISTDLLKEIVKQSSTFKEILGYFGILSKGGNPRTLKLRLKADNIDFTHISLRKKFFIRKNPVPLEQLLVDDCAARRGTIKKRLIKEGLLEERCNECGLEAIWQEKKLIFVLDHINGKSTDYRIENLRLLCPNCNSQTSTYCGRNLVVRKHCSVCLRIIHNRSTYCRDCSNKRKLGHKTKIIWPNVNALIEEVDKTSYTAVGKRLGVSDVAVRKHIKSRWAVGEWETRLTLNQEAERPL